MCGLRKGVPSLSFRGKHRAREWHANGCEASELPDVQERLAGLVIGGEGFFDGVEFDLPEVSLLAADLHVVRLKPGSAAADVAPGIELIARAWDEFGKGQGLGGRSVVMIESN